MSGRRRARGRMRDLIDSPRALAMIAVCGVWVMVVLMVVFVQAADYAVLANKASPADNCRLKPVP